MKPGGKQSEETRALLRARSGEREAALKENAGAVNRGRQTETLALMARFELIVDRPGEDADWRLIARMTVAALKELLELRKVKQES
jgi:hypothetical protein